MKSETLDQLITLQQPSLVRDGVGQPIQTWGTVAQVWAQVQPLRGRELLAAQAVRSEQTIKVRIRWCADVRTTWRVLWGDLVLNITATTPVGRQDMLELMCVEGLPS